MALLSPIVAAGLAGLLRMIGAEAPVPLGDITEASPVSPSTARRALARLVRAGLVRRVAAQGYVLASSPSAMSVREACLALEEEGGIPRDGSRPSVRQALDAAWLARAADIGLDQLASGEGPNGHTGTA